MIRSDYIMRMMEMLVTVLKKVMSLRGEKKYEEAIPELEAASKQITGIDLKLAGILDINDILYLMKTVELDAAKCLVTARLMKEYAGFLELKGDYGGAQNYYIKSLRLFAEALNTGQIPEAEKYYSDVDELLNNTKELEYSDDLQKGMLTFYEMKGDYAKAENIVFHLIEKNDPEARDIARNFYNRLLQKSGEELSQGNLTREEIEESLEEIKVIYR